ncbi:hypothetical protein V8G54_003287 [Vigna mungo]|uniref:Uncharacterized protein n=1 Tax=Vigna mungo TaxID=3915 RepID=A0AAQ3PDK3_VIGMU
MIHVLFQTVVNHCGGRIVRLQWTHLPHACTIYLTRTRNQMMVADGNLRWHHCMVWLLNVGVRCLLHSNRHSSRSNRTGNIENRNRVYCMSRISRFLGVVDYRVTRVEVLVEVGLRFRFRFHLIFLGVRISN